MRLKTNFKSVRPRDVGLEVVKQLRTIYPDGLAADLPYCAVLYADDPRAKALQDCLEHAGKKPRQPAEPFSHDNYWLNLEREYEPSDFADCRYLEFIPRHVPKLYARKSDGMTELNRGVLRSSESFLMDGGYFASGRAKRLLETEKFSGLMFKPTKLRARIRRNSPTWTEDELGPEISWKEFGPPWWEMVAERVMPSLAPSMTLIAYGRPPEIVHPPVADRNRGYTAKEGLYTPAEFHYRASDLAKVEPIDYARPLEDIGRMGSGIVVSNRFYDFCQHHDLKADWVPVRVDPD